MGGRSGIGEARAGARVDAIAAVAVMSALGGACATSPPPLPPPPETFAPPAEPGGSAALARAPVLPLAAEAPLRDERYGGWTLAADLAAAVPTGIWLARPNDSYLALPMLTLTPVIHAVHGEWGTAAGSLIMRAVALGTAYAISRHMSWGCSSAEFCVPIVGLVAVEAAILIPMAVDGSLLAHRRRRVSGWDLLPVLR